jgi:hypothetical protein
LRGLFRASLAEANEIKKFFKTSTVVDKKVEEFELAYKINYDNTIGIHYRGTDKSSEIKVWPVENYLFKISELLAIEPKLKIYLLTDQQQVFDIFKNNFGENMIYINELPMSSDNNGIHYSLKNEKEEFGVNFLSAVLMLSKEALNNPRKS